MYYIGDDGKVGTDANGNLLTKKMDLTVSNVAMHLNILTELYKSSKYDENGNYIAGDQERIADGNALSSIEKLLSGLTEGENVEYTKGKTGAAFATAGIAVGTGLTASGVGATVGAIWCGAGFGTVAHWGATALAASAAKTGAAAAAANTTMVAAPIVGAVAGGAIGYGIANEIVKNDKSGDFVDQNGNFREQKATSFKHTAILGGGVAGGLLGAAGTAALVGGPVGWLVGGTLFAVAATVGICALIKKFA